MSGLLRTLKKRIRTVENTRKITRAMEMVATAKFHRYQGTLLKGRAYTDQLEALLNRVMHNTLQTAHPFLEIREGKRCCMILMTSDAGLCGSYNYELKDLVREFFSTRNGKCSLIGVGKKGIAAMTRDGFEFKKTITGIRASNIENAIVELRKTVEGAFLRDEVDEVYVTYGHCLSLASYRSVTEKLLPLGGVRTTRNPMNHVEEGRYIYEPSPVEVIRKLVAHLFETQIRQIFLEAFMSEQIARMRAMHQATENGAEMMDRLTLERNKVRQAAITREIIEVVTGSRALKK